MRKSIFTITGFFLVMAFSLTLMSCSDDDDPADPISPTTTYIDAHWDDADLGRGGLLYDKWWSILEVDAPTEDFDPIWSTQETNTRSGADSWRCKECHGWDYKGVGGAYASGSSHFTGFAGVLDASGNDRTAIFDAIKDASGDHNLSGVLEDADVLDLTKFIVDGLVDMSASIDYATKASLGDAATGQPLYEDNCLLCHGEFGTDLNFGSDESPTYLGDLALDNPWETLHKIRWGHPGTQMPSSVEAGLTSEQEADILAYSQTMEPQHYVDANWDDADPVLGGLLYDKWWKINNGTEPSANFDPIWSTQNTNTRSGADTWRCKECHGWDYKGVGGAYAAGSSHFTGFAGVLDASTNERSEIFDAIKDAGGDHDLSGVLSDADVLNLTKVIVDGLVDMSASIDYDTKAALGNTAAGQPLYEQNCLVCHGEFGTNLNFGSDESPKYLGDLALENPWETLHKLRWGHPGTAMPSTVASGLTAEQETDILTYSQTLEPQHYADENWDDADLGLGGLLYDKWWKINNGVEPVEDFDPIWGTQNTNTRSGPDSWRCKECHGWDYKGAGGAYASGSHFTGFAGVFDARVNDKADIFDAIKDAGGDHDLSGVLSDEDVLNVTKHIVDGLVDMSLYIDYETKGALGDVENGQVLFGENCAACHGADGRSINFGDEDSPKYVHTLALDNPWETLHKIKYGHPGTAMRGTNGAGLTADQNSDILAFCQALAIPTSLVSAAVITVPVLDGVGNDEAWGEAETFVITVGASAEYANSFGEVELSLTSVHTATDLYILATWTDPSGTESIDKNQWSYGNEGWGKSGNEDRFFMMFDAGDNGAEGANCATMCHVPDMYTTGGGHVDVWHWKAHRTTPVGCADDKWWDADGRGSDAKTVSAYSDNKQTLSDGSDVPLYTGPVTDGHYIIVPTGETAESYCTPFDTLSTEGVYPGYILFEDRDGSRFNDVAASSTYDNGVWTVELRRALNTGNDDDVALIIGETVNFSTAITDNSGGSHSGAGVFDLTIE